MPQELTKPAKELVYGKDGNLYKLNFLVSTDKDFFRSMGMAPPYRVLWVPDIGWYNAEIVKSPPTDEKLYELEEKEKSRKRVRTILVIGGVAAILLVLIAGSKKTKKARIWR